MEVAQRKRKDEVICLRPFQSDAVRYIGCRLEGEEANGVCHVQLPTGTGKTLVINKVTSIQIERQNGIVIILVKTWKTAEEIRNSSLLKKYASVFVDRDFVNGEKKYFTKDKGEEEQRGDIVVDLAPNYDVMIFTMQTAKDCLNQFSVSKLQISAVLIDESQGSFTPWCIALKKLVLSKACVVGFTASNIDKLLKSQGLEGEQEIAVTFLTNEQAVDGKYKPKVGMLHLIDTEAEETMVTPQGAAYAATVVMEFIDSGLFNMKKILILVDRLEQGKSMYARLQTSNDMQVDFLGENTKQVEASAVIADFSQRTTGLLIATRARMGEAYDIPNLDFLCLVLQKRFEENRLSQAGGRIGRMPDQYRTNQWMMVVSTITSTCWHNNDTIPKITGLRPDQFNGLSQKQKEYFDAHKATTKTGKSRHHLVYMENGSEVELPLHEDFGTRVERRCKMTNTTPKASNRKACDDTFIALGKPPKQSCGTNNTASHGIKRKACDDTFITLEGSPKRRCVPNN